MTQTQMWLIWQNRVNDSVIWVTTDSYENRRMMVETCDQIGSYDSEEEAFRQANLAREYFRHE